MYKNPTNPDEIKVFFDEAEYISDPQRLIDLGEDKESIIKVKAGRECPVDHRITIRDAMLDARGPVEDKAYGMDPFLLKNIRRGNTILEIKETSEGEPKKYLIGRKGLNKFFDIKLQFIEPVAREDDKQNSNENKTIKNYQLAGALKALLEGHQVEIIKTLKANGENA